jgi:hypothetical protein
MATISGAALCAVVATLFWTGLGFALTRRLVPAVLALPLAPAIGFAVHSAVVLPVFFFVPFTPAAIGAVAVLILAVAVIVSSRNAPLSGEKRAPHVPAWSYGLAALLAMASAAAVLPKLTGDAVLLADPIFDHAKVALIDDMARLGVPPGNPFFADEGRPFAYYYLWHFGAAEVARLLGRSGWDADAGLTWFSAFASLAAMMGLAVWLARRASAAPLAVVFAATASARYLLWDLFGAENVDAVLSRPAGFAGFVFQSAWVPQHIISAALVMVAICLIAQLAHHRNTLVIITLGLVAAAGFESSTWIGGFAFAASALFAVPLLLFAIGQSERRQFLGALAAAAIIAAAVATPLLRDQFAAVATRSTGSPIAVEPHDVFGEAAPAWLGLLDLPGFWLVFLPLELAAIYIPGIIALVAFLAGPGPDPDRRRTVLALAALAAASLTVSWLLVSTLADNNDLGWRAVLPAAMALTVFSAAGLARWIAARAWTAIAMTAAAILVGLPGMAELIRSDIEGRREVDAILFAQTPEMWAAVRRHAGPGERVANNPLFLADMTLWPVDISWALLADLRSCYAGRELALVYASLPRPRLDEIDTQFIRVFAGKAQPGDVEDLATKYDCQLVVLTSADGAWASDPFLANPRYRLVEEKLDAWRIYRVAAGGESGNQWRSP